MQVSIQPGDLGVVTAAIRDEGTTAHYMPAGFPAVADLSVTLSLLDGGRDLWGLSLGLEFRRQRIRSTGSTNRTGCR